MVAMSINIIYVCWVISLYTYVVHVQYKVFNVGFGFPSIEYKPTWTSLSSGKEPVYSYPALPRKLNNAMTHSLAMQV